MTKKKRESDAVKIARANRHSEILRLLGKIIDTSPRIIIGVFLIIAFKDSIHDLAGKDTITNIRIDIPFLKDIVSLVVGGGGIVYGSLQKKFRKDDTERHCNRIKELEQQADKNRTGSNLTSRGDTNPKDI